VQDDVYQAAAELPSRASLFVRREGRLCFDLWQANRVLLCAAGLAAENIETAGLCTMCHSDEWYSSRREGPGCGHFGLMAALVEPAP
jgi:copper oxidase (laccase) domain-containing protein